MSVSLSKFFNSINGDRMYNSVDFRDWVRNFFSNGVFQNGLSVVSNAGMNISVSSGYVHINGAVQHFGDTEFEINEAGTSYPRIDSIIVEYNNNEDVRDIVMFVQEGSYSGDNPQPVELIRNYNVYQIEIAQVMVYANSDGITQAEIVDSRDDSDRCGYVINRSDSTNVASVKSLLMTLMYAFESENTEQFNAWWSEFRNILLSGSNGMPLYIETDECSDDITEQEVMVSVIEDDIQYLSDITEDEFYYAPQCVHVADGSNGAFYLPDEYPLPSDMLLRAYSATYDDFEIAMLNVNTNPEIVNTDSYGFPAIRSDNLNFTFKGSYIYVENMYALRRMSGTYYNPTFFYDDEYGAWKLSEVGIDYIKSYGFYAYTDSTSNTYLAFNDKDTAITDVNDNVNFGYLTYVRQNS